MVTLTVFPGATSIGCGLGGFLLYIPSEEPEGGGDCASPVAGRIVGCAHKCWDSLNI